ncbi:MAG: 30S ribosomal protein S7 [Cytophagales bacterium]|nr:30S ribosomal protein S7 [Cytophagales bacterium]
MMRKGKIIKKKTVVSPDPKYNSVVVQEFINHIMIDGKKNVACKIFYGAIEVISQKTGEDGIVVWEKALENVAPSIETKRRRVGGANLQVPVEVYPKRRKSLSMRWIIKYARERSEKTMVNRLAMEIIDAYNNEGRSVKKKNDVLKMAESNRALASLKL